MFSHTKQTRLIEMNYTIRASYMVQACKYNTSLGQENPNLYQECYTLVDTAHILQIHHPDPAIQGCRVPAKNIPGILSSSPLEEIGKGACIFVAASGTEDAAGWVVPKRAPERKEKEKVPAQEREMPAQELRNNKKKNLVYLPPKSMFLASHLPTDFAAAKVAFKDSIVGFMLRPKLYMSTEATQTAFAREVASVERVILEGELVRFPQPYKLDCPVRMDGGLGGYFRMLFGSRKSKRYQGVLRCVSQQADYIDRNHREYKTSQGIV